MLSHISHRQKHLLAISLILAAGFYLVIVFWAGHEEVLRTIRKLSFLDAGVLLLCSMCNYSLRYWRWHLYAKTLGFNLNKLQHYCYYLSGFALTTTPAKAGELIRSLYLRQHGMPYHKSVAMFVTERFLDVLVIACLATLTVYLIGDYGRFVIIATCLLFILLLLIKTPLFKHLLIFCNQKSHIQKIRAGTSRMLHLLDTSQQLLANRLLFSGVLLGVISWSLQGLAFYYILEILGLKIEPATAMGIYAISLLAGAATFIPGGIGGTEVVMGLLLVASGVDASTAISAPLISRLSTLWFAVALGLFANAIISQQRFK